MSAEFTQMLSDPFFWLTGGALGCAAILLVMLLLGPAPSAFRTALKDTKP